jgi:predicted transcriptional regulator
MAQRTITIRLGRETEERLTVLARRTKRSASLLAAEAIRAYLEKGWQLEFLEPAREGDARALERMLWLLGADQRPEPVIRF